MSAQSGCAVYGSSNEPRDRDHLVPVIDRLTRRGRDRPFGPGGQRRRRHHPGAHRHLGAGDRRGRRTTPARDLARSGPSALADLNRAVRTARDHGLTQIPPEQAAEPLQLFRHAVLVGLAEHRRADGPSSPRRGACSNTSVTAKPRSCASPSTSTCRSRTTAANATCGQSGPKSRSPAVTTPPPAPPPGYASVDTSPPSANTATTYSPPSATPSPEPLEPTQSSHLNAYPVLTGRPRIPRVTARLWCNGPREVIGEGVEGPVQTASPRS